MTLFDVREPAPRLPVGMLSWSGIGVPAWPFPGSDAVARAVAETIELGAWCDALAWRAVVDAAISARGRVEGVQA